MTPQDTSRAEIDFAAMSESFARDGFAVVRGLFSTAETNELKATFEELHAARCVPGYFEPAPASESGGDPLKEYPRVMHPHRFNDVARRYLLHPGLMRCLRHLLGEDALAAQSMYYFKPPGSRGQAMHQDNFYLLVTPQTCVAAWTAIDDADPENGGMYLVPETADEKIVCPEEADSSVSFTTHLVRTPEGKKAVAVPLKSGDTLFFNGNCIHGSGPNRSEKRFRRAFIGHYVPKSTQSISRFYLPLLNSDGDEVLIEANQSGGACGEAFKDSNGVAWAGAIH